MKRCEIGESEFVLATGSEKRSANIQIEICFSESKGIEFNQDVRIKDEWIVDEIKAALNEWIDFYAYKNQTILKVLVLKVEPKKGYNFDARGGAWWAFHDAAEKLGLPYRPIFEP